MKMDIVQLKKINNIEDLCVGDFVGVECPEETHHHPWMVYEGIIEGKHSFIRPYREKERIDGNPTNLDIFYRRYTREDLSFENGIILFGEHGEFGIYHSDDLSEDFLKRIQLIANVNIWRRWGRILHKK
jgi:hypothetical protein